MVSTNEQKNLQRQQDLQKHLYEYNKIGFTPIHEASYNGYINAVKRYYASATDKKALIEVLTKDNQNMTPILLGALGSRLDVVAFLYESGANLNIKNASGHGIVDIAILRQDIKILNYLIDLSKTKEKELDIWTKLVKLLTSKINEISASAGRCLELLTDMNSYKQEQGFNETSWLYNCLSLIENSLYGALSKVILESTKDTVISSLIVLINCLDYGTYIKAHENVKIFLKEDGYNCLIVMMSKIEKLDEDSVVLMNNVLKKLSDSKEKCQYFSHKDFKDMIQKLFDCLIKCLELKKVTENQMTLYSIIDFLSNLLEYNEELQADLKILINLTKMVISFMKEYHTNERLVSAGLRNISFLATKSPEIQNLLIDLGFTTFLIESLKSDSENLKILAIECIIQCCKSNVFVQKALFKKKIDDMLLHYLSRYIERLMKTISMQAVWSIAGDDILQRQTICKKISLELINECISDQEGDLYQVACNALIVLFEQPPNVVFLIHENFLKIEMIAIKLVRILSNEHYSNVIAALHCIKKMCSTCGENGYKKAQFELKNAEVIPLLITLIIHAKQTMIRAEAALSLAYVCLENKENIKVAFETLDFSYLDIFNLLRVSSIHTKLLITKALAMFAFNNLEQETIIGNIGVLNFNLFKDYLNLPNEIEKCEGAYQIILLSPLIYNQEGSRLVAIGIRILISYLEKENTEFRLKRCVLEIFAGLSKLKNGIAEALLAINIHDILCDGQLVKDVNCEGYIAIILSNLTYYPNGRRQLLKKCRKNPSLFKIIEKYSNFNESRYKLPESFLKEWYHMNSLLRAKTTTSLMRSRTVLN